MELMITCICRVLATVGVAEFGIGVIKSRSGNTFRRVPRGPARTNKTNPKWNAIGEWKGEKMGRNTGTIGQYGPE